MNNIPLSKNKQENYLKQGKYQFTCPLQTANLHNRSLSAPGQFIFIIPVDRDPTAYDQQKLGSS